MTEAEDEGDFFERGLIRHEVLTRHLKATAFQKRTQADAKLLLHELLSTSATKRKIWRQSRPRLVQRQAIQPGNKLINTAAAGRCARLGCDAKLLQCFDKRSKPSGECCFVSSPIGYRKSRSSGGLAERDGFSTVVNASKEFQRRSSQ